MGEYKHEKIPVIIGIGQELNRATDISGIQTPLDMIIKAIQRAEEDSCVKKLMQQIDTICLVNILSHPYDDPLSELISRIDIRPRHEAYTWIGATGPQWFVNQTTEKIVSGKTRLALICGGEAFHSNKITARMKGDKFEQWNLPSKKSWMVGDLRDPLNALEIKYGLMLPINIYPLFENALRFHENLSIDKQREELGEFCAKFSSIASRNRFSWFPTSKTVNEITQITKSNPMISFPYTRSMCSFMQVDQSAAIFLTDEQTAKELGVPQDKWVYPIGAGDASDIWHVSERKNYFSSPSVKVAVDIAMKKAGTSLQEIDYLDFYSCFPSATRIVCNTLGMNKHDKRPLTVTGGMAYFGGPGNNYSLHAICKMTELLRKNKEKTGMVHALSWFISKHSVGIYSGKRKQANTASIPTIRYLKKLNNIKRPLLVEDASGDAVIEAYSIFHNREGNPESAVIIGRLDNASRFLSKAAPDRDMLNAMMKCEFVGERGKVQIKNGFNIFQI